MLFILRDIHYALDGVVLDFISFIVLYRYRLAINLLIEMLRIIDQDIHTQ